MNARSLALLLVTAALLAGCAGTGKPRPAPPTLDEIVGMSRDKVSPEQIIARIRDSGGVYRLSGSQLAKLHQQGVDDRVLDHLQATYVEDVRRDEYMRSWPYPYWGPWGYGPPGWRAARPWGPWYPYGHYWW